MTDLLGTVAAVGALLCSGAAVIAGLLALGATRRPGLALSVFLDLLLAAGLLRLVGSPGWQSLATAATVVAIRHLVTAGLSRGATAWSKGVRHS